MSDTESGAIDYVIRVHGNPADIAASEWNELLSAQPDPLPFLRHEFLLALHQTGCASGDSGWTPAFITLHRGDRLVGAVAAYLKSHSYGEYVFDWAWADAYRRHGLDYYPKLLAAVPFTPVPGPRLLASSAEERLLLMRALRSLAVRNEWSSAHLLFGNDEDFEAAGADGWMIRHGVQFHWRNRMDRPYADFADFLAALQREKRKKIQQERRRVAEAGITFEVREGAAITEADWRFFHRCYSLTYRAHGSTPYLNLKFFQRVARELPRHWLMFMAQREGQPIAASLVAIDPDRGWAWGRYWGATEAVSFLHFEACYYQPLQWCIEHGYRCFEGGAQGEHKMARGLTPTPTRSAHWLAHPQFARAVEDFLAREGQGVAAYLDELRERDPFKAATTAQEGGEPSPPP
ncbi:MAG TPA: GNAT family N-acetyltransferase [Ideonella sp.]|uniref:GNAT family N-acetyltransferase n=1 Tax=Ideonella sp. TaxID=1929293 RepID=UPI002E33CEA6|nr:GNAT family N-acetyltransferase [Ideonella sp.]HEX5683874.1 GNAT family N-acetyltransferase [Ideonella sp.]